MISDTAILVHSGQLIDLAFPDPAVVRLNDIAHALARINRFTGHGREGYTDAQHSVVVSYLCPGKFACWALLHDAHEYLLGDMSSPLKCLLRRHTDVLDFLARGWDSAISEHFNVPRCDVKQWDNQAAAIEASHNGPFGACGLDKGDWMYNPRYSHVWPSDKAENMFLTRAEELGIHDR